MLIHQEKLKFYMVIINFMLTKVLVKPISNGQHLNEKQVKQNN